MQAELIKTKSYNYTIKWESSDQFGEISFTWDDKTNRFIVDSEMLGVENIIEIIKSIK